MSLTEDDIKEGVSWTWTQVRRALLLHTFVGLLIALCVGFGSYWYASYKDIAVRMGERLPAFEQNVDTWIEKTAKTFSEANTNLSNEPRLPSIEDVRNIQENVTSLISGLNNVPTPTQGIENTSIEFRLRLSSIVREIGRYDSTPEAVTRIVYASHEAAKAGGAHNKQIEDYFGSTVRRLWGSL